MATKNLMIQLYTEEFYSSLVTEVYPLDDDAYLYLDSTSSTVVRELSSEVYSGMVASHFPSGFTIGFSSEALTELKLLPLRGETQTVFYAPSHVTSPAVTGAALAILHVALPGLIVDNGAKLTTNRAIGAHAYVDQTD
jgi:hypothetical protein